MKIVTDCGLYGIGEAYNRAGVVDHVRSIKGRIIGQYPLGVDYLYQRMCEAGVGQGSRSGSLSGAIYLELPDKPGLGIELNEEVCRAHLVKGSGYFDD